MLGTPQPKDRPYLLVKRERQAARTKLDQAENRTVRERSGGRCEVRRVAWLWKDGEPAILRCHHRASEIHHLKGGLGRRNRGESILADWKLHVCKKSHADITGHVLVPLVPGADAHAIVYRRRT